MPFKQLAADYGELEKMMSEKRDNLTFTGIIKRELVTEYYQASDLFFLPSMQETFGMVIVEAAAAGLPVLLRNLDQYHITFGSAYERGTDETFAKIIERFKSDDTYYREWQQKSAEISERYGARAGAARLMDVYREVLAAKREHKKNGATS
jgi:1,2-diacylglycerol-3-alpha-glucose alpha-1,2-galactosyltransferase